MGTPAPKNSLQIRHLNPLVIFTFMRLGFSSRHNWHCSEILLSTLPETNSSPLKMDGWKMYFLLKVRPFLGAMLVLGRVNTSIFSLENVIPFPKVLTFRQVHCIVQPSMDFLIRLVMPFFVAPLWISSQKSCGVIGKKTSFNSTRGTL